jgi:hypothetical protein
LDVIVRETRARESDGLGGHGLQVQLGGRATVNRFAAEANHGAGIYAISAGSALDGTDLRVSDTDGARWMDVEGLFGEGLVAIDGAAVDLGQALLENNREAGVVAHSGGTATLADFRVVATLERACVELGGCENGAGSGLVALDGGPIDGRRFEVADSALAGVQVSVGGEMDLSTGEVRGSPVGANVQPEDYDISRLMDEVRYLDNGLNLDSTSLPLPDPPALTTM